MASLNRFRLPDGTFPLIAGGAPTAIENLEARNTDIVQRLEEIQSEFEARAFTAEAKDEWNALNTEIEDNNTLVGELRARDERFQAVKADPAHQEQGAKFNSAAPGAVRGGDIYDLTTMRAGSLVEMTSQLRDRAMRSLEVAKFPEAIKREDAQTHIEGLIERLDSPDREDGVPGEVSRRMLTTGSPIYRRAFTKYLGGKGLTADEQRALSVGTGANGGFGVVYMLDPTIIPTSNLSVNPFRDFGNVETIAGTNEWRGVTSGGVTATRRAEAAATTDASPSFGQPAIVVSKVDCFIPISIELTQDWATIERDLTVLIQDAKDDEEATSFATGTYSAGATPGGLITMATSTTTAGGTASFAVADVYKLWESLPPRFRARAAWLGNLFTYDKVRQFDAAGGASLWVQNLTIGTDTQAGPTMHGSLGATLLSKPSYESTAMASALTTGSKILAVGDGRYFKIIDRLGMDVELIPHLFGPSQGNLPTGQRGIYAYWRNGSKLLDPNAWRVLVTG